MRFRDIRALGGRAVGMTLPARRNMVNGWRRRKRCYWCNIKVSFVGGIDPTRATREHLIPRSFGGGGGKNITVACARCNNARGTDSRWIPWDAQPDWTRVIDPAVHQRVGVPLRWDNGQVICALREPRHD